MGKELELAIKIGGKIDASLGSAVNNAQSQLNALGKGINAAGLAVTTAVTTAGIKLVKDSVQTYQDYQSAINSAAATGGIAVGTAEYEALNSAAREAGATTVKTAKESANALEYMMLAGWSVADSTQALLPVLKLSASTGADLATTSDLVTDSMANMGLGINDLNHYLDVSAAANNKTNQTATQLQEAYIGVGATLKNLNSPIEESAAVLGVLANRGTKGSEAGTKLSAVLVNMQKTSGEAYKAMKSLGVSMYDSSGNARSIIDVFQDISDKTANMSEEQRNLTYQMIGGKANVGAFSKIMAGFTDTTADGTKEIYSLIEAFQNCDGALDNLYDIKTDTLEGSVARLNSAFDDMKISIGEKVAPYLQEAFNGLADKMPEIENIITSALENIIPAAANVLNYLVDNSDKVISAAIGIAKAFAGIKIGSSVINGINSIVKLGKNLSEFSDTKAMQNFFSSLTGISAASGGVGGTITSIAGSFLAAAAPIAAVSAGFIGVYVAANKVHDYFENKKLNYADGMSETAAEIGEAVSSLTKYNDLVTEISNLRMVIATPESSAQEVETAKTRLQEIADMLGEEYDLVINADTTELEHAAEMAQRLSRTDMLNTSANLISEIQGGTEQYKINAENLPGLIKEQQTLQETSNAYQNIISLAKIYNDSFKNNGDVEAYRENLHDLYNTAKEYGIENIDWYGNLNEFNIQDFLKTVNDGAREINEQLIETGTNIETINKNAQEFEQSAQQAGQYLTEALASDIINGNSFDADTDIQMLKELGSAMTEAGVNTADIAAKFAAAKAGYTDFAAAISDGKAQEMAQNFIEYETAIGETAETAVQGAALIQNGFENVTQATEAGNEAINNIINDMKSLGDAQGLFDGLNADGVADKLTDMAHAMSLIPENKSITIDANGNFSVIEEAENQIASLKSIGDVDISVNANGDFSVLNEATGEIQTLQGMGAVSLEVNAAGNIDVLNKAGEVIATIDSKNAEVSVDGQVIGMDAVEQAAQTADNVNDTNATVTITATDNASQTIFEVQNNLTELNRTNANPTLSANDQASGVISNVAAQLNDLDGKVATTTVITNYVTNGNAPASNASGTSYFDGGLTYVNDQNISDPREVIEHDGMRYWYEGRNILTSVPRGAKIYTAAESRAFINGSHKNGLDRVPFDGYIAELHEGEQVLTADEATDYGENGMFAQASERLKEMMNDNNKSNRSKEDRETAQIVFSPSITIEGDADKEKVLEAVKMSYSEFKEFMREYERDNRRKVF